MTAREDRLRALLEARKARARPAAIPRHDGPAPLSPMQESIWLRQQMEPDGTGYHRTTAFRLSGPLDVPALRAALSDLVGRHHALRSVVVLDGDHARQHVRPEAPLDLPVVDLGGAEDPDAAAAERTRQLAREPFDLERGPLVRAALLRLGPDLHQLVLLLHHVVFDAASEGALRADLEAAYAARRGGQTPSLAPLAVQMADVAAWTRGRAGGAEARAHLDYWRSQLEGLPTRLDLPTDRPRAGASGAAETRVVTLPDALATRLRAVARREGTTLYAVLLSAFEVVLARYARQTDFAVGTPVSGRTHAEMEGVVGCLINLLVVRARVDLDAPFRTHLARVHETVAEALAHQDAPISDVLGAAFPERRGFDPVYQVIFQLKTQPPVDATRELTVRPVTVPPSALDTEMGLDLVAAGETLTCVLSYRTDLFDPETIERFLGHYAVVLEAATSASETPVGRLPLLTDAERHHVLVDLQTPVPPPLDVAGVHVPVERHAAARPDAIAIEDGAAGGETWTYGRLNATANRLARRLRARGVGPGAAVAIGFGMCPEAVVAMLAVSKAGGAYVPLDPEHPAGRIESVLEAASARLVLTRGAPPWPLDGVDVLDVGEVGTGAEPEPDLPSDAMPADRPAYVLFTSGSTGEPKGVVVTQANLLASVPGWNAVYDTEARRAFVVTARPTFDVFSEAWVRTLGAGLRLVLCPRDTLLAPAAFVRLVRDHDVDVLDAVPAVFRLLTAHLERTGQTLDGVGLAIAGSDVWRPDDHARLQAVLPNATVLNSYGITETTVSNTVFSGPAPQVPSGSVPIGRAYPGSLLYVLDAAGQPVPVGVPGELHVGGPVVGAGYLGRPDLTAERFLADPFASAPGARMYRTGDRARWLPSGDLEFLGRIDFQVKIRGLRVELGEVEAVLSAHASVDLAVADVQRGAEDDDLLVAYVVPAPGAVPDVEALRADARRRLPPYMVPAAIAVLDAVPLSANGKVDRRRLPALATGPELSSTTASEKLEAGLAEIWAGALHVSPITRDDDFFDVGGHSLAAMQVVSRVRQRWGVSLTVRDIVEAPVLAALAARVAALADPAHTGPDALGPARARGGPPQTDTERELARVWCDVLGTPSVGRDDDFFDIGGHSLRAIQVLSRVNEARGTALAFRDVVEASTLASFAERVDRQTVEAREVDDLLADLGDLSEADLSALLGGGPPPSP